MIIAMTSTCARDIDLVARLNQQLVAHNVQHHMFVEARDADLFRSRGFDIKIKPDEGLNGFGAPGAKVRWHCHQQMLPLVSDEDTFVNIDSDVYFVNENMISDLACAPDEVKGFAGPDKYRIGDVEFYHLSGMIIAAAGNVFRRTMNLSHDEVHDACITIRDASPRIEAIENTPSEDVVASYLYQTRGNAIVFPLEKKYVRQMDRAWESTDRDVTC